MSIEEAQSKVITEAHNIASSRTFEDALDRLILEVEAEMPCYEQYIFSNPNNCLSGKVPTAPNLCPSCQARTELKVPV